MGACDQLDRDRISVENFDRLASMHTQDDQVALRIVGIFQDHLSSFFGTCENTCLREVIDSAVNLTCELLMSMEFEISENIRQRALFVIDDADDPKIARKRARHGAG